MNMNDLVMVMLGVIFVCFVICLLLEECRQGEGESEVYRLIREDMLDSNTVWSGSGRSLRNRTKGYLYSGYGSDITFLSEGEEFAIEMVVTLSKVENEKLGKLAESILVRKFLEAKS